MALLGKEALDKIRSGELTLGLGVHQLRGSAVPMLAKAAGYDWLFIDSEHGTISTQEISQICLAALPTGVAPIVRICAGALDEGTRALDNGALGIVVPHVDTVEQARHPVDAFRFQPMGHRSTGGPPAQFGFRPPAAAEAQKTLNAELLVIPMIETPEAVENADKIAAIDGIDEQPVVPGRLGQQRHNGASQVLHAETERQAAANSLQGFASKQRHQILTLVELEAGRMGVIRRLSCEASAPGVAGRGAVSDAA